MLRRNNVFMRFSAMPCFQMPPNVPPKCFIDAGGPRAPDGIIKG